MIDGVSKQAACKYYRPLVFICMHLIFHAVMGMHHLQLDAALTINPDWLLTA